MNTPDESSGPGNVAISGTVDRSPSRIDHFRTHIYHPGEVVELPGIISIRAGNKSLEKFRVKGVGAPIKGQHYITLYGGRDVVAVSNGGIQCRKTLVVPV